MPKFSWVIGVTLLWVTVARADQAEWAVIIYVAGDERVIEEPTRMMLKNIMRMPALQENNKVQFVIYHDATDEDPNHVYAFRKTPEADPENQLTGIRAARSLGEQDSGDPLTLLNFLTWAKKTYPAKHTILILSGHSWGKLGAMQDFWVEGQTPVPATMMKPYELKRVLQEAARLSGGKEETRALDALVMDACIAGTMESAMEVAGEVKYFAASALESPDHGIPFWTTFPKFLAAVNQNSVPLSDPRAMKQLELEFLKPLVSDFVVSHSLGGSLVAEEQMIDPVQFMAVRTSQLRPLASAIKKFVKRLPEPARVAWQRRQLQSLEGLWDIDRNADIDHLMIRFEEYFSRKAKQARGDESEESWLEAAAAANKVRHRLGYAAVDLIPETTSLQYSDEASGREATGAWVHLPIDGVARRNVAILTALQVFAQMNAGKRSIIPKFFVKEENGKEVELKAHDLYVEDLVSSDGEEEELLTGKLPLDEISGLKLVWPSSRGAYVTERRTQANDRKHRQTTVRELSLWIENDSSESLRQKVVLRLPGVSYAKVEYFFGDDSLAGVVVPLSMMEISTEDKSFKIDGKPGLYVAEGHNSGSVFKRGLSLYLGHDFPHPNGEENINNGGRNPIEWVEEKPFALSLADYFTQLGAAKNQFGVTGVDYYRALEFSKRTLWDEFLFSN